jgi:hypothetical protein
MKTRLWLVIGISFCCVCGGIGEEAWKVQSAGAAPKRGSRSVRAIVEPEAQKLGNRAVLFQPEGSSALRVKELIPFHEATSQIRGTKLAGFLVIFLRAGCSITD